MRFSVFQSFCISVRPLRSIGFLRSHRALAVSDGCRGLFSPDNVRRLVTQAVSSSHKLAASSKRFHLSPAPNIADTQAGSTLVHLPWGLRVLFTTSVSRIVAAPGLPTPDTFRPWCSSHLRRFDPRPTLRVYFTPQPLTGFTLQGISLSHSHDISSTPLCLRVGSTALAIRVAPYATYAIAAFKALSPCESPLSEHWCLAAALPAPFLSFPSSRFCSLCLAREVLPPLSAHRLMNHLSSHLLHRRTAC